MYMSEVLLVFSFKRKCLMYNRLRMDKITGQFNRKIPLHLGNLFRPVRNKLYCNVYLPIGLQGKIKGKYKNIRISILS